jgi:hypothetical protein
MPTNIHAQYNETLVGIAEKLDIPLSKRQQAEDCYKAVGGWLDREGSSLQPYRPRIHPQGSFRLGTVVRPLRAGKEADYDIDLVCQLEIAKDCDRDPSPRFPRKTAKEIKLMVGERLSENGTYQKMLDEEGKRCWTLDYAEQDGIGFHIDILPAVPEERSIIHVLESDGVPSKYAHCAIGITDRNKNCDGYDWSSSNPDGYGQWFDSRTAITPPNIRIAAKQDLFESNRSLYASVEQVPDEVVRTPLQRAIQILKRHRDNRFAGKNSNGNKPISMIITTLAALLYDGEADVYSALMNIVAKLDMHAGLVETPGYFVANAAYAGNQQIISRMWEEGEYKWYIGNPVNPRENFADRWHENDHAKAKAFFQWVAWVRADLINIRGQQTIDDAIRYLSAPAIVPVVGPKMVIPEGKVIDYSRVTITRPNKPWGC